MKTNISTAPKAILDNYNTRRYGNASMAAGALDAAQYAFNCHYDIDEPVAYFTAIAETLKDDFRVYRLFMVAHADEVRAEEKLARIWQENRAWAANGPSYEEVIAANQAAAAADQLEAEITAKAEELYQKRERERELTARARAVAHVRKALAQ